MTKKEYIQKAKQLILNRVKFHAPIVFDNEIDCALLQENGIDVLLPVFKFKKTLNKALINAFDLAKREENFNLVLVDVDKKYVKHVCKMQNVTFLDKYSSKRLLEMINKLNINYHSSTNFNLVYKDRFASVNDIRFNPNFDDFCLKQESVFDDVFVNYCEFILNGQNVFVKFVNKSDREKRLFFELNIPLEKGYYYLKKLDRCFLIENLLSKRKMFFNFSCPGAKFLFSNVDGLENSVYCCINVKVSVILKPKQIKHIFFNLGESKFGVKNITEIEALKDVSIKECKNNFDVRVLTRNPKFDLFFNKTLPQKIWLCWLNGDVDNSLEQKYLTYRRLFIKGKEKISFVKFSEIGVKEIGIFNGDYYKKILLIGSNEKFLKVGKTHFYNVHGITKKTLTSTEPVVLSFGK